ncbi:uncharacterized protein LOC130803137 [Amaranthus tricolor]|uniref:uncharacterized protein LOC130803137 n=1 Tax=Amaranthus tricolor TaxID=29722 RepID=UPI00258CC868|nr:uncharacterized protein LOC130803137 [Amaranthus tricolor]
MAGNQGKGKGFFKHLLSGNSSRPILLRGDPDKRGVTGSTRRARQEDAARHSEAQRSSTLNQVRTRFDDQASSHQSSWGVSSDDDDADDVEYQGAVVHPVDWTVLRGSDRRFARVGPSSSGASERTKRSLVENEPPQGSRRSQSAGTDWLVTSPQLGGPQISA